MVALTQLADGHYLMGVTGGSGETLTFYRSTITDLASINLSWVPFDSWYADPLHDKSIRTTSITCRPGSVRSGYTCLSPDELYMGRNWPTTGTFNGNPHQTLQFIREATSTGRCFSPGRAASSSATTSSTSIAWSVTRHLPAG